MNDYQQEQLTALQVVLAGFEQLGESGMRELKAAADDYMRFRREVDRFLKDHFSDTCTQTCYRDQTSACCSKDGIITFFADTVINALYASPGALVEMSAALERDNRGHRCVYLTSAGCMWTVRPVVCAMFLCDRAMDAVFPQAPAAEKRWRELRSRERTFKWPDRPVLFDRMEKVFMDMGLRSTLMHLNLSPGLLMVKKKAGLL
jgi:hypothetical protein